LKILLGYEILDTEDEKALHELTQLAGAICGTSISPADKDYKDGAKLILNFHQTC